MEFAEFAGF